MNYFMLGIGVMYIFAGVKALHTNIPLGLAYFCLTGWCIAMSMVK